MFAEAVGEQWPAQTFPRIVTAYTTQSIVEMKANLSVVVVYEDNVVRERAVGFCDHLVGRFWATCGFDVNWWSFGLLQESLGAGASAEKAAAADLIIFAAQSGEEMPVHVRAWVESWLDRRGDREGALVGLVEHSGGASTGAADKQVYLRNIAHRSGMDYLTEVPQNILDLIPESLESYTDRAHQVTGVLDEILHHPAPPPHLLS
jgi:hypothetical protein